MINIESRESRLSAASPAAPKPVHLSIVIPAYNEEMGIVQTVTAVNQALSGLSTTYEVVVVDDGSTDNTAERAESTRDRKSTRLNSSHRL